MTVESMMNNEQELLYLRSILNAGNVYIVRTDSSGSYTYTNNAYIKAFYPNEKDSIIGRNRWERIADKDQALLHSTLELCLQNEGTSYSVKLRKLGEKNIDVVNMWEFTAIRNQEKNIEIQTIGYNITTEENQKQLIEEQQLQITHLYSALDLVPVSVIVTDQDSNITYINKAFTEDTGYAATEVLGKNPRMLASGLTLPLEYSRMWKALSHGEKFTGCFVNRKKSGENIIHEVNIAPITFNNKCIGYVSAQHDITELVRRTEEYERLLDLYEATCRLASVGGWEHSIIDNTIELTAIAREIFEVEIEGPIPLFQAGMFYKEGFSREKLYEVSIRAIEQKISFEEELEIITAKGKERIVRLIGKIEKRNNTVTRLYGSIIDITEQKKAEKQLKQTMEGLRCLIDNNPHGVFTINPDGFISSANDTVLTMLHSSKEVFIGSHYSNYIFPKDLATINNDFLHALQGERKIQELAVKNPSDHTLHWHITGIPIMINDIVEGVYVIAEDISEKKLIEEKFKKNQQLLDAYFNSTGEVIIIADENYTIIEFNAQAVAESNNIFAKSIEIGSNVQDFAHLAHFKEFSAYYTQALHGQSSHIDYRWTSNNTIEHWHKLSFIPIKNRITLNSEFLVALVIRDITEEKHNQDQLLKTRQILDAYFNSSGEVIVISDSDYKVIAFNAQALAESVGIFGGEISVGASMEEYAKQTGFKEFHQIYARILNGETIELDRHWRLNNYEGWRHISYMPVKNQIDSRSDYLVAFVIRDISDRKKLELSLQERTKLLERVTTLSPVFITVSEIANGNVIYSGRSMFTELGYSIDVIKEIMSKGFEDGSKILIPFDMEIVQKHIQKCKILINGSQEKTQFRMKRENGDIEWVELRTAIFERDSDGNPTKFINAYLFVTEQVTLSQKLKEINEQLEERVAHRTSNLLSSLETTNSLIELLSHDVRNKLGGIYLQGEMMQLHAEKIKTERLESIGSSIVHLTKDIRDLLDDVIESRRFAETGFYVNKQKIDLQEFVTMAISTIHIQAESKNLTIIMDKFEDTINVDIRLFKELFDNFLSNAVKFSPQGKKIYIGSIKKENELILYVKDEGPGIHPDEHIKLFTRFGKLSARPTGGEKSTGLGLVITKQIAKVLDCRVWCESELGKGATFFVSVTQEP
ncbi:MAG: PAS domain S-box protein [Candidatus Kapaibacterium sp.]|jgi:PAS domain S-box-containing protein